MRIDREVEELHRNGVRLRFIGDRQALQRQAAVAHGGERGAHRRQHAA